jgi:hypothetical protein
VLVFGDHNEIADPIDLLAALDERIDCASRAAPGLSRHAALVGILIEAGRLLQGLADAEFAEHSEDRRSPTAEGVSRFVLQLAKAVCRSWDSGFARVGELPAAPDLTQLPSWIELRTAEGFAFYSVYPEAYLGAARRLSLVAPPRVIGIRSIGTTLAAAVAAALDAPVPVTVRLCSDPFARELAIASDLENELLAGSPHYVVVDEGPGLSGSSFGAVADWLQERGVPLERIAFIPSHAGAPGPQVSAAHRQRWAVAQRAPAMLDDLPRLLGDWVSPLIGEFGGALTELSGGEWRRWRYSSEEQWPAVNPGWERRKFLAGRGGERFLVKFAGLGSIGERKLQMARALHSAGFAPEPIGFAHGFLVERWCDDAPPLADGEKPIAHIAHYIGARARLFPAEHCHGASLAGLLEMCRRNVALALGGEVAGSVEHWRPRLDHLSRRVVRVCTDNRLLPHEWFRTSGRVLKTDALDHHVGHDLIGCQDMAWDVAGAIVEFELDVPAATLLIDLVEHSGGRHVDPELLAFYGLAYLAFRTGQATLGADSLDESERERLRRDASRYRRHLEQLLQESTSSATRPLSLVG